MEHCCGQAAMVHADHVNSWWGVELLIPLLKHTKYYYFWLIVHVSTDANTGIDLKSPPKEVTPSLKTPGRGKVRCPDCRRRRRAGSLGIQLLLFIQSQLLSHFS
jgi:hypothetical protein